MTENALLKRGGEKKMNVKMGGRKKIDKSKKKVL